MKIKCQEHYDKVAEYAKSIGDTTFQNCIERLKQWEKNSGGRYEIELYYDFAPYSFGFAERTPDGRNGIVGGLLYHGRPDESFAVMMEPFHGWSIKFLYHKLICNCVKNGAGKVKTPFLIKPPLLQLFVAGVDLYFGCIMHIALTIFTHYYATYYGGFIIDFLLYL